MKNKKKLFVVAERLMKEKKIFREKDLTINKLATVMKTNRTYLSLAINEFAKCSFCNYINRYRIEEAKILLTDKINQIPIKHICDEVGYNSMNAFYESFKKNVGVPPSLYRKISS